MHSTGVRETTKRRGGLFFLPHVMDALVEGQITPRGAILLAGVDSWCNSYKKRHDADSKEDVTTVKFSVKHICRILHCNRATVRNTIESLRKKGLLKARRLDGCRWELKPAKQKQEGDATCNSLYIRAPILKLFEQGQLTPMEMLILGYIACYACKQQLFFGTNRHLGKMFGISTRQAMRVVQQLIAKRLLAVEFLTRDELHERLAKRLDGGFAGCGPLTARLLVPMLKELLPRDHPKIDDYDDEEEELYNEEDELDVNDEDELDDEEEDELDDEEEEDELDYEKAAIAEANACLV